MIKKILLSVLTITVVGCIVGGAWLYGAVNKDIDEHYAGTCEALPLAGSAEDTQVDRERGFIYLSHKDRKGAMEGIEIDPGTILRVDLNASELEAVPALVDGPELGPHGISLFISPTGERTLFVINHPKDRDTGTEKLERYIETSPGQFKHQETYTHPDFTRGNDLVAVGPNEFYIGQDVAQGSGVTETKLLYYNGSEFSVVADDIQSAGGINVSQDLSTLYIAETSGNRIRVAKRDMETGAVETEKFIELPSGPDNIDVAEDGTLTIGAHSNIVAMVMHFIVGTNAPTQILSVDPQTSSIDEIYLNKGTEISMGSGGSTYGNKLLIGSIMDRKLLVCTAS